MATSKTESLYKELFIYLQENVVSKVQFDDLKETVIKIDGKLDTVVEQHAESRAQLKLYREDRKWFVTGVVGMVTAWLAAMAAVLAGCIERPPGLFTEIPFITPSHTATHVATPFLLDTCTPTPTPTAWPTVAATPEFVTPTPVNIMTPPIFEVTPLGGYSTGTPTPPKIEEYQGEFTPYSRLNVRMGPGIRFPVFYCCIGTDATVHIYAWVSDLPSESWGCMSEPVGGEFTCTKAVAMVYNWIPKGLFVPVQ